MDDVGIETISRRNRQLTGHLADPEHRSAIVMVRHDDPAGAVANLAEQGIIVDHRPGHVRVSPHVYNTEEEIDRCVEALASYRR